MFRPEILLADGEREREQRASLGKLSLVLAQQAQVVQARGRVGMVRPE
jgi:hypothetical protein